jgi:hypothetical protein
MLFFEFPEGARWNDDRECVEFSVILRPYEGTARVGRRVFQGLLDQSPTPERCVEAFHLQRTRFEMIVERKLRRRQLTDDGDVEVTGRDLREKTPPVSQSTLFERSVLIDRAGPTSVEGKTSNSRRCLIRDREARSL